MTASQFRRIVLGLPGVVEASHMSHPDFRAANGESSRPSTRMKRAAWRR
jgi:hypothetical protein